MKIKLLIVFVLITTFGNAQITVRAADMPSVNDTVRYSTSATNVSALLNDTGAGRTWNFSSLRPDFQDKASFKTALSINFLYAGAFSSSTYGTEEPDISFTAASATDVYSFYKNSTASFVADGRAFSVSSLPLTQPYIGKDIIYEFPLKYGNRDTNSYYTDPVNLVIATLASSGKRINVVDGWGSLTTPYGTFNCVRVKSIVQQTDTLKITQLPFPIPVSHNKTEYKWIANGQKIPILEISVGSGTGATTTIKYRDINRPEVFWPLANFTASKTAVAVNDAAAPCKLFNTSTHNPKSINWTVTPNTFTFVNGTTATSDTPQIVFGAAGKYTVKLKVTYNAGSDDSIRIDYIDVQEGPKANFGASITGTTNPLTIVNFYDSSTGNPMPTSWKWTFLPNKVSFVGGTSSTSQNPKITFDSATNYAVTLKATNTVGSSSITKNFGVFNTGIKEAGPSNTGFNLYPNPSDDHFVLNLNRNSVERFEVYDITGRAHQLNYSWNDQNSCTVDCSQLNAGIYFIKVYYQNKQTVVKRISVK